MSRHRGYQSAPLSLVALLLLGSLTACSHGSGPSSSAPLRPAVQLGQMTVDGVARKYRVFAPPTPGPRAPSALVMVLHGGAATIDDAVTTTLFDQAAVAGNFIVAYPQGTREEWNAGFCCGSAPHRMIDDVGFLSQFLDRIEADYPIDPARVFVTGVSNGAMMAYYFACQRADRVAAVGSVAGAMVLDSCHPSRPVSVIEVHGTADPEVPYLGGQAAIDTGSTFAYPSSQAVAQRWVAVDGCDPQATGSSAGPVMTAVWTRCQAGSAVSLVSVAGGGHVWFAPGLGPSDGALDATMVIWRFFNSLPVK